MIKIHSMKKVSYFLFLAVWLLPLACGPEQAIAQNDKEIIRENVRMYMEASDQGDWNAVMDLIYPPLFNIVPREEMIKAFEGLENEGMKVNTVGGEVLSMTGTISHEGEKFALVNYNVNINLMLTSEENRDSSMVSMMEEFFKGTYGKDNVAYSPEDFSFELKAEKSMFAINAEGSDKWYFLENNPQQNALLDQLIPAEVREELNQKAAQKE